MRTISLLLVLISLNGIAQNVKIEDRLIKTSWRVTAQDLANDMKFSIRNSEAPFPGGDREKQELLELKKISAAQFPRIDIPLEGAARGSRSENDSLSILDSFAVRFFFNGNPLTGGTPNDNTLAISNDGNILVSYNSQLWGYDLQNDTFLFKSTNPHPGFGAFMNSYTGSGITSGSSGFDPKLYYDPSADRFVFLFLTNGRDTNRSSTVIAFSSTNYPSNDWYAYELDGNPFKDGTWTDYPQIALNNHSLYLTLNQLNGPDWVTNFDQTIIWQLDLDSAYAGVAELPTRIYSGFEYEGKNLRYLRPVKTAFGPDGDDMYFISNRPRAISNDSIWLIRVTGSLSETSTTEISLMDSDTEYGIPPYAAQQGAKTFWTNDARPLGAMRVQNEIHFVGNTINQTNGKAAIFHGIVKDVENPSVAGHIIAHDEIEFGFPNIEFLGLTELDRDFVINFNHTSPNHPAGNSAIFYTNGGHGPIQLLKKGDAYVDMLTSDDERWGDYIGLQRKYNATSRAFAAGYFGHGNNRSGTWVTELAAPRDWPVGLNEESVKSQTRIFPNPVSNYVSFEFTLPNAVVLHTKVISVNGALIRDLGNKQAKAGLNELSLDLSSLPSGIYFILAESESGVLLNEKVVRN
jgi:hypothetical protein